MRRIILTEEMQAKVNNIIPFDKNYVHSFIPKNLEKIDLGDEPYFPRVKITQLSNEQQARYKLFMAKEYTILK